MSEEDKLAEKEVGIELKKVESEQKELQDALTLAKTNNDFIERCEKLESKKSELEARKEEIKEKKYKTENNNQRCSFYECI